jgi:hypothetical protein
MADRQKVNTVKDELDRLTVEFFRTVSFEPGETPAYENIPSLFVEPGLLIKNSTTTPEISTVRQFIDPRQRMVAAGELTRFREWELSETTAIFGNVAHRFSAYAKSGTLKGVPFEARGMISTQFVLTPDGWRMSVMAWDDERPGLSIPDRYDPSSGNASS